MYRRFSVVAALGCVAAGALFSAGSPVLGQTASPQALAEAAYKAMGMDGVQARALTIGGTLQAWDPGESEFRGLPVDARLGHVDIHPDSGFCERPLSRAMVASTRRRRHAQLHRDCHRRI